MKIAYLLTNDQMLNYLTNQGLDATDKNFELNANLYRASAHKKICNYLGYEIVETVYTDERYSGNGMQEMYIYNRPITELTAFSLGGEDLMSSVEVIDGSRLFYEDGIFTPRLNNIKISYTAGYNQTTMPGDIRHATMRLISLYTGELGGAGTTIGKASVSDGSGSSESIDMEAEERILSTLDRYVSHVRL